MSDILRQAETAELPPRGGAEEIAIRHALMPRWRGAGSAAQHHLVNHEFAVVLTERTRRRPIMRIGQVGASGPLPHILVKALHKRTRMRGDTVVPAFASAMLARGNFPFEFGGQSLAGPFGIGRSLVMADMTNRLVMNER